MMIYDIQDSTTGKLDRWLKKEGDSIKVGEDLCHVSVGDLMVGVESQHEGILAQITVPEGSDDIPSDDVIGLCVNNKEEYTKFLELQLQHVKETIAEISDNSDSLVYEEIAAKKPIVTDLLKILKYLINNKIIEEESEFSKKLLSLARKGHEELLDVFAASFAEGCMSWTDHTQFDANFFLDNATDIVDEVSRTTEQLKWVTESSDNGGAPNIPGGHVHNAAADNSNTKS